MNTLQGIFNLILLILQRCITADFFTSVMWGFIVLMIVLLVRIIWKGVLSWKL